MHVAVIGAGVSGLTAAKAIREVGLTPVVYEASADVGGLWVYGASGPAYRSLRTNTSKQVTAFSDLPFACTLPNFPAGTAVDAYLQEYAARFALRRFIRLSCAVHSVERADPGCWRIVAEDGSSEVFDAVLVCTGIFRKPVMPVIPGLQRFPGTVLHSMQYRSPEAFAGQRVLVVGLGSSAVDIALDLLGIAGSVSLSVRRGVWIVPRTIAGRPLDHFGSRLFMQLPEDLRSRRRGELVVGEYARRGIESPAVIWAQAHVPFDPETAPGVASDALLLRIMDGEPTVYPEIERIDGSEVVFVDGRRLRTDTIIFCTGYTLDFPFLPPELRPWVGENSGLYRLVFPPSHPNLGFIGVCRAHGPILPIVEMQARWAARVLAGEVGLPAEGEMRAEIVQRLRQQSARQDSPIRVTPLPYLDQLAELIGVQPRLWRYPRLLRSLLVGPPVAAQYRLDGPDRWDGAGDTIAAAMKYRPSGGSEPR